MTRKRDSKQFLKCCISHSLKRERIKGWVRKSVEVLQNTRETEENKILPSLFTVDPPNYGVCVCVSLASTGAT
jgi:hypothetical protein